MASILGSLAGATGGAALGRATVFLGVDARQLTTGLATARKQVDSSTGAMEQRAALMKGAFIAFAAVAGAALIRFGISAVRSFSEAQQVMAQTEAVLESTGGAAGVTAEEVASLAAHWQDLTGIQDEAVQGAANILLTFTQVRNELGAGNDIFDQATAAALDLATALNLGATPSAEQLKGAALQLGKALNDPISGMTALRRAGVSFTAAQREQIKALIESGDLLGAQKIILAEVAVEFGNAAEAAGDTFAGRVARLSAEFDDFKEVVGSALIPVLEEAINFFTRLFETLAHPLAPVVISFEELTEKIREGTIEGTIYERLLEQMVFSGKLTEEQMDALTAAYRASTAGMRNLATATREGTLEQEGLTAAQIAGRDAARELEDAERSLAGGFLGLLDDISAANDAQREANTLRRVGKTDTKAYSDAVLEATRTQLTLTDSLMDYIAQERDSGATRKDVIADIKAAAAAQGVQGEALRDLIALVKEYIRRIHEVPTEWTTTFRANFPGSTSPQQQGGSSGGPGGPGGQTGSPASPAAPGIAGITINVFGDVNDAERFRAKVEQALSSAILSRVG